MAAPLIAGMLIRKESRAACSARTPMSRPAEMVDPERETPGQIAMAWAHPMAIASTTCGCSDPECRLPHGSPRTSCGRAPPREAGPP